MSVAARVRIGVIGCGMVAQAEHLPYLSELHERFEIVAIADPSRTVREAVAARYGIPGVHDDYRSLLDAGGLDAVLIAVARGDPRRGRAGRARRRAARLRREAALHQRRRRRPDRRGARPGGEGRPGRVHEALRPRVGADAGRASRDRGGPPLPPRDRATTPSGSRSSPRATSSRATDVPAELIEATQALGVRAGRGGGRATARPRPSSRSRTPTSAAWGTTSTPSTACSSAWASRCPARVADGAWWNDGQAITGSVVLANGARWDSAWIQLFGIREYRETIAFYFEDSYRRSSSPRPG